MNALGALLVAAALAVPVPAMPVADTAAIVRTPLDRGCRPGTAPAGARDHRMPVPHATRAANTLHRPQSGAGEVVPSFTSTDPG